MKYIKLKRLWNGLASIRDNIVRDAINRNEAIEVTVEGMKGHMLLTPSILKTRAFQAVGEEFDSKFVQGMKYKLIDFAWKPEAMKGLELPL